MLGAKMAAIQPNDKKFLLFLSLRGLYKSKIHNIKSHNGGLFLMFCCNARNGHRAG